MLRTISQNRRGRERGSLVLDGDWQFIKAPELERITFSASRDLVVPNPNQPRTYFNKGALTRLAVTVGSEGQKSAIWTVPIINIHTGEVKLFIIDGERRHRTTGNLGQTHENVEIRWEPNIEKLMITAFVANDAREPHNPIEKAKLYKELLGYQEDRDIDGPEAIANVAQSLGLKPKSISDGLKLLELPEEIQQLVARGFVTPHAVRKYDFYKRQFDKALFTNQLLDAAAAAGFSLDDDDDVEAEDRKIADTASTTSTSAAEVLEGDSNGGARTARGKGAGKTLAAGTIDRVLQQSVRGKSVTATDVSTADALRALTENLARVAKVTEDVAALNNLALGTAIDKELISVDHLLRRLQQVREAIARVYGTLDRAYAPEAVNADDRLIFSRILGSNRAHGLLGDGPKRKTVLALAEAATNKNGGLVTLKDLYTHTGLDHAGFNAILPTLKDDLRKLGLSLEKGIILKSDKETAHATKYHALRLVPLAKN